MPIKYLVSDDGHFIHAVAGGSVTGQEFVEYEIAHAIDKRIKPPVAELFEIQHGALRQVTRNDVSLIMERRKELSTAPTAHRCAMVVSYGNAHAWDIAKFYEGMTILHSPEVVIIFGDSNTAKLWLGFDKRQPKGADAEDSSTAGS